MNRATARSGAAALALALLACAEPTPPVEAPRALLEHPVAALIGTEARSAALIPPGAVDGLSFVVSLPARPVLAFGFGLPDRGRGEVDGAGTFELSIEAPPEPRRVIGRQRVDPAQLADRRWFDARLDLSRWSGRDVVFGVRVVPDPGAPTPLGAIANPTLYSESYRDDRPNLLVVSIDTLRARSVGAYGYARDTTPFLDRFAQRGALFETALTTSVTTAPSHMSVFTGLYPVNHGMRTGRERKGEGIQTLAQQLRHVGYRTVAFTENGFIVRRFGFGEGFDEYTENRGRRMKAPGEVRITFPQAERWIARRALEPFFAFVHTYQVHAPFLPPQDYARLFAEDGLDGPEDPLMRRSRDDYDREIRYVDDALRGLVGALEAQGMLDRTLVVILADHGEEFQEHGYYQHGGAVFEETIRIPLIMVGPGVPAGRRVLAQVSLIDVLPTVLELLGVPRPPDLDGISLAPALASGAEPEPRTLFTEAHAPKRWKRPFHGEDWNPPLVSMRTQDEKFIVHRPDEGEAQPTVRYDLAVDALERAPQTPPDAARRDAEAAVERYLAGRTDVTAPQQDLDPDLRERLERLGYLDAEVAGEAARARPTSPAEPSDPVGEVR